MVTGHDDILHHRVTPCRGAFRLEAVTAAGAVEVLATWPTEEQAVEELRLLQIAADRATLRTLAAEDGPKAQRGKFIPPLDTSVLPGL